MSRKIEDLTEETQGLIATFRILTSERNLDILLYCTYRPAHEQARLYCQGRSRSAIEKKAAELEVEWERPDLAGMLRVIGPQRGPVVTNAGPGQSIHQYRMAADGVPMIGGKPVWGASTQRERDLWALYGECAEEAGLEWAGRWTRFREFPHVQMPGANWRDLIERG